MKEKSFVSIIWGYHGQFFGFSKIQNYQITPLVLALNAGYRVEAFLIAPRVDITADPNFDSRIKVTRYQNPLQMALFLWRHRNSIVYANSVIWQNLLLVPFFCRHAIFMAHDSIARRSFLKQIIQDLALKFYWRIRVISPGEKDFLLARGFPDHKVFVAPLAIDTNLFSDANTHEPNQLVYIGNVTPDNDLRTILKAFHSVVQNHSDARLHIIGEVRVSEFYDWIKEYALTEKVILHGYVPHSDLSKMLPRFSIFVNSVISSGQHLAIFEAALSGLALCLPESMQFSVFKDAALFHNLHDADKLADNIEKYLNSLELIKKHTRVAREIITSQYAEAGVSKKMISLFDLQ